MPFSYFFDQCEKVGTQNQYGCVIPHSLANHLLHQTPPCLVLRLNNPQHITDSGAQAFGFTQEIAIILLLLLAPALHPQYGTHCCHWATEAHLVRIIRVLRAHCIQALAGRLRRISWSVNVHRTALKNKRYSYALTISTNNVGSLEILSSLLKCKGVVRLSQPKEGSAAGYTNGNSTSQLSSVEEYLKMNFRGLYQGKPINS